MPANAEHRSNRSFLCDYFCVRRGGPTEASTEIIPRGHGQYSCCVVSKPDEGIAHPYAHGLAALLAVLLDAQERGYKLGTESNGAFTVSNSSSTSISMLYSNEDIQRFGRILAGRPR